MERISNRDIYDNEDRKCSLCPLKGQSKERCSDCPAPFFRELKEKVFNLFKKKKKEENIQEKYERMRREFEEQMAEIEKRPLKKKADLPPALLQKKLKEREDIGDWKQIYTEQEFYQIPGVQKTWHGYGEFNGKNATASSYGIIFREQTDSHARWGYDLKYFYSAKYNCILMVSHFAEGQYPLEFIFKRVTQLIKENSRSADYPYKTND